MKHQLPVLPYQYSALEPYIDEQTMRIHHAKHHQAYVDKLNAALEKYPEFQDMELSELIVKLPNLKKVSEKDKMAIKNNGGGHLNHSLYWQIMSPQKQVDKNLVNEIEKEFGSLDDFKKLFSDMAVGHFGSGWAWLARDNKGKLKVYSLPNQDSPYSMGDIPIICLDVWEHAYYLKYQNRRTEYIESWWKVLKLL